MAPSLRPSSRQALASLQFAISPIARPNPVSLIWRWRYELALAIGFPASIAAVAGPLGLAWTIAATVLLVGGAAAWPASRRQYLARAWCVITPHRVRSGCAQAWIHSRRGKIPIVLLTTHEPFGERVLLWCRAGTSAKDLNSARHLLATACWARDVQVSQDERFAQLVTLDVIRHVRVRPEDTGPESSDTSAYAPPRWPGAVPGWEHKNPSH